MSFLANDVWKEVITILLDRRDFCDAIALSFTCHNLRHILLGQLREILTTQYWCKDEELQNPHTDIVETFFSKFFCKILQDHLGDPNSVLTWRNGWENMGGFFLTSSLSNEHNKDNRNDSTDENKNEVCVSLWRYGFRRGGWWCERVKQDKQSWRPDIQERLSDDFASGHHVPLNSDLLSFFSAIVPKSGYVVSSWIDIPLSSKQFSFGDHFMEERNSILDKRAAITGPHMHYGLHGDLCWVFKKLRLIAVPINPVWDNNRVDYYKERMKTEVKNQQKSYIPTCVILSPCSMEYFSPGGIILDGHHKIQAAADLGHSVRIILFQMRDILRSDKIYPLPWYTRLEEMKKKWWEKYPPGKKILRD